MKTHRIAVMPGDGIGKEVVPEGMRVLEAAARKHSLGIEWREFGWNCDYYAKHGRMMPEDWFDTLSPHDAIYYGVAGGTRSIIESPHTGERLRIVPRQPHLNGTMRRR